MWKSLLSMLMLLIVPADDTIKKRDLQLAEYLVDTDGDYIVPIATIHNGKLLNPVLYRDLKDQKAVDAFIHAHYSDGTPFRIWQSGEPVGNATISGVTPGCDSTFSFGAKLSHKLRISTLHGALAISEDAAKPHASFDRAPTMEERTSFARSSQIDLSKAYPAITSKTRFHIHSLFVTKAAETGNPLLIGSISFSKSNREYWLFGMFERRGEDWSPQIVQIHRIKDLEDRTDAQQEQYLDQMDVDGDGIDEVFTISTYYEAFSFAAYGIRNGRWVQIYDGGYGGC